MNDPIAKIILRIVAVSLFAAVPTLAQAQPSVPDPPSRIYGVSKKDNLPVLAPMTGGDTSEKSIAVDKNVNLSLCVTQGSLKVNGWNRSEIRVFVKDGAKFGFNVQLKSPKTNMPALINLTGLDAKTKGKYAIPTECIWGDEIEIDVPVNAVINIKGQETTTVIDTVRKASVKTIGGSINLRNIAEGAVAVTYEGDVTVESSTGAMSLESTNGNVTVFGSGPSEIGDQFKAKTNSGNVNLQKLDYRQVDVTSISGSVSYNGEILSGGSYSLSTSNGSIRMSVPVNTSCQVVASYGFGTFNYDLPLKIETENIMEGPVKRVVGKLGTGGASVRLTTNSGSIVIKKP